MTIPFPWVPTERIAAQSPNALSTGPFGSAISSQYFRTEGVPVIRGSNLSEDIGTRLFEGGLVFLDAAKAAEFSRSQVQRGDLVFTCWGTVGQVGLIDHRSRYDKYVVSNKQMKLTPDSKVADSLFLYYVFSSPQVSSSIKDQAIGSSVPGFNLGQLRQIPIPLPPLSEQRAIASILGALDDKIELNRRMNETLEDLARTIFKSWFVDFDPVKAKAEGRQPEGMDAETAKLFPSGFVESELGMIPEGWPSATLGDVLELKRGHDLPSSQRQPGQFPICSSSGISGFHAEFKAKAPGVVTGRYGTIGQVFYVETDFWPLNTTLYVNDFKGNDERYAFYSLKRVRFENYTDKAAVPGINRNHVHQEPMVAAPLTVQKRFRTLCDPIWRQQRLNADESSTLSEARDYLLPRLISGELRIPDAEKLVEARL